MNKFENLTNYLKEKNEDTIKMSFSNIENIIGFPLPESASKHRAYFANVFDHSISKAWMEAGYRSSNVNIYNKTIEFVKECCFGKMLLSSCVFSNISDYANLLKGKLFLSGVSFCESIFLFGLNYGDAYRRLSEYNVQLVDDTLNPIDIDFMYGSLNNAKLFCLNTYNIFIKISLFECLITIFHNNGVDKQCILDSLVDNSDIFFDFPYSLKSDISLSIFAVKMRKIFEKIKLTKTYDQLIEMIGNLDYKNVTKCPSLDLSFIADNYSNSVTKEFIHSCKTKKPYIPVDYVSELLNIQILSENNDLVYLTSNGLNNKILVGKILDRVTLINSEKDGDKAYE